ATKRHKSHKTFCDFCAFLWLFPFLRHLLLRDHCSRNSLKVSLSRELSPPFTKQSQHPLVHSNSAFHQQVTAGSQKVLRACAQPPVNLQFIFRREERHVRLVFPDLALKPAHITTPHI